MTNKKNGLVTFLKLFAWSLVVIAFFFILVFVVIFAGRPFSNDMAAWGELGSYGSFIISIFNLVCFIVLTYKASEFEIESFEQQSTFQMHSYMQQMHTQKIELQTDFRKSHIDTIRQIMLNLNNLTCYDLTKTDEFGKFKRECESLRRMFLIFQANKNSNLIGSCDYSAVNGKFEMLDTEICSIQSGGCATSEQEKNIWNALNEVNFEIISLEKELSDYTLEELEKAFTKATSQ